MSGNTKIWLIVAAVFVVIGLVMVIAFMTVCSGDFTKLSTITYETNEHEVSEAFRNISINTDTADIQFVHSQDDTCKVVCYEAANAKHTVTVEDDTLTVSISDERKWYDHIGINFGSPKIKVYVPYDVCGSLDVDVSTGAVEVPEGFRFESMDITASTGAVKSGASSNSIKIKTSTGAIRVENAVTSMLDLSVTTGRVTVTDVVCQGDVKVKVSTGKAALTGVQCKNLITTGSTGSISLRNVTAKEKFSIERTTGDVKFDGCDAAELFVQTKTGNVTGSLLSEKVFITETATGNINVPKSTTGGKCEITTSTGNIKITIEAA